MKGNLSRRYVEDRSESELTTFGVRSNLTSGKAVCHCSDCRKTSGTTYSTNIVVPGDGFKLLAGSPKEITKTADSGKQITNHFCGDCGTTLWRDGETFGSNKIIRVGVIDDPKALSNAKPDVEFFVGGRASWVTEIEGAPQLASMA